MISIRWTQLFVFFFVNSSTSITGWKVNSRRLLLCSVLSFKFKLIYFLSNKKEDRSRLWWQDSVCEMLLHVSLLFSFVVIHFRMLWCGVFLAYPSTAKKQQFMLVFIACFSNSFNCLFRYKEKSTIMHMCYFQFTTFETAY